MNNDTLEKAKKVAEEIREVKAEISVIERAITSNAYMSFYTNGRHMVIQPAMAEVVLAGRKAKLNRLEALLEEM